MELRYRRLLQLRRAGEVVGLARVAVEALPASERSAGKIRKVLGPAPKE